jgi:stress-induced morphogen
VETQTSCADEGIRGRQIRNPCVHKPDPFVIPDPALQIDFSLQIVSAAFAGKTLMQRHRLIYGALQEELAAGLHALSLKTKTPEEATAATEA